MSLTAGTASASCTRLGERTVEPPIAIAKCSKLCASTQMTINPDTKPSSPSSSISSILQPRPRTAIGLSALDHRGRPLIGHHKPSPNHWPKTLTLRAGPHPLNISVCVRPQVLTQRRRELVFQRNVQITVRTRLHSEERVHRPSTIDPNGATKRLELLIEFECIVRCHFLHHATILLQLQPTTSCNPVPQHPLAKKIPQPPY